MKNHTLRNTILAALGTAALAASTESAAAPDHETGSALQAGAVTCFPPPPGDPVMSFHDCNFGSLTGTMRAVDRSGVPPAGFTRYLNKNHGGFFTVQFYRFTVGTADETAAGKQYTVTITMRGRKPTAEELATGPLQYPSFTVWAMGSNPFREPDSGCHSWSQLRGPNDDVDNPLSENPGKLPDGEVVTANNVDNKDTAGLGDGDAINPTPNGVQDGCLLYVGVVDGHDGWVGYAYTGPDATTILERDGLNHDPQTKNGTQVIDALPRGWFVNHQSPFVDGAASSGKVVWDRKFNRAKLVLRGVKPGGYLIGAGGGCAWVDPAISCSQGVAYTMTVETQPEAE